MKLQASHQKLQTSQVTNTSDVTVTKFSSVLNLGILLKLVCIDFVAYKYRLSNIAKFSYLKYSINKYAYFCLDIFQLLPSVPSLCRDRVNMLLSSLNGMLYPQVMMMLQGTNLITENYTGVIQESVYHSILVNAWEVSKAAGDMSMFLKSQLASRNNLGM